MSFAEHRAAAEGLGALRAALITISDTRTPETDDSGRLMRELIEAAGHTVTFYRIVPDEIPAIQAAVQAALAEADFIVASGGTGMTPRDVTIEACRPLFTKELDGFGELFRLISYQEIGSGAVMSRATAGAIGPAMLFCLPGSKGAVRTGLTKLILPEVRHLISHIRRV
jgi:molybdenum cofactor biosynthesis protein B